MVSGSATGCGCGGHGPHGAPCRSGGQDQAVGAVPPSRQGTRRPVGKLSNYRSCAACARPQAERACGEFFRVVWCGRASSRGGAADSVRWRTGRPTAAAAGGGPARCPDAARGPLGPTIAILVALGCRRARWRRSVWTDVLWFDSLGFRTSSSPSSSPRSCCSPSGAVLTGGAGGLQPGHRLPHPARLRPGHRPQQQILDQYREAIEPLRRIADVGVPVVLGLLAGSGAAAQWQTFLLWRNRVHVRHQGPAVRARHRFFVFTLPWLRFVARLPDDGARHGAHRRGLHPLRLRRPQLQARGERPRRPPACTSASCWRALVLVRAGTYWLDRYSLATQKAPLLTGITYTDAHAVLPTKAILAVAALMCAALFLATIWTRSWRLPVVGVALLVVTASSSAASTRRCPVLQGQARRRSRSRRRTSTATSRRPGRPSGSNAVNDPDYEAGTTADPRPAARRRRRPSRASGWSTPTSSRPTFKQLAGGQVATTSSPTSLDVDRYTIDGKPSDTVIAVRELDLDGRARQPAQLAQRPHRLHPRLRRRRRLRQPARRDGQPVFFEQNIPPVGTLGKFEPRIYFGEKSPDYSIVGGADGQPRRGSSTTRTAARPAQQQQHLCRGRRRAASARSLARLAYAIKYRELNFLLSDAVNDQSRILDHRTPRRAGRAGRAVADPRRQRLPRGRRRAGSSGSSTATRRRPTTRTRRLQSSSTTRPRTRSRSARSVGHAISTGQVNYIRNSVKATVDAYDGTVRLYAWDDQDPVLKAWSKAFPGTVQPMSEISGDLMSHLRYPRGPFKVQRDAARALPRHRPRRLLRRPGLLAGARRPDPGGADRVPAAVLPSRSRCRASRAPPSR